MLFLSVLNNFGPVPVYYIMSEKGTPSQKHKKNKMNIEKTDRVPDSADISIINYREPDNDMFY